MSLVLQNMIEERGKEIKRLRKENEKLKEQNLDLIKEVMRLGKIILEQEVENKYLKKELSRYLDGE